MRQVRYEMSNRWSVQFGVRCNAHVSDCDRIHVRNGLARMLRKWRPHVHANRFGFIWFHMRQVWYKTSNRWSVQFGVRCNADVSVGDGIRVRNGLARMLHKWRPHVQQINLTSYDPNAAGPVRDIQQLERAIWSEMQCSRQ